MFHLSPLNKQAQAETSVIRDKKPDLYNELGLSVSEKISNDAKEQNKSATDFMTLIIAQLQCQNPMDPQDSTDFLAQLAQFNAVETNQKVLDTMNELVSAYQSKTIIDATTLIGKKIEVDTNNMQLVAENEIKGIIEVPTKVPDLQVSILNSEGNVVRKFSMGEQNQGKINFIWDGTDNHKNRLPDGNYKIKPQSLIEDDFATLKTTINANVDNVAINKQTGEVKLSLAGVGEIDLEEVRNVSE